MLKQQVLIDEVNELAYDPLGRQDYVSKKSSLCDMEELRKFVPSCLLLLNPTKPTSQRPNKFESNN